jgi:hypothetical protein
MTIATEAEECGSLTSKRRTGRHVLCFLRKRYPKNPTCFTSLFIHNFSVSFVYSFSQNSLIFSFFGDGVAYSVHNSSYGADDGVFVASC